MIWVDYREKELIAHLDALLMDGKSTKTFRTTNLPIGDIVLTSRVEDKEKEGQLEDEHICESDIICIMERKTVIDMAASIRDGRYEEQAYRLNDTNVVNHQIIYVIEGDHNRVLLSSANNYSRNKITPDVMYSSFASIIFFKGFSLYRSFNIQDTALFIVNTHRKLHKDLFSKKKSRTLYYYKKEDENEKTVIKTDDYNMTLKKKSSYISQESTSVAMLCQIPGISTTIANVLISEFGTVGNLTRSLNEKPDLLDDLRYVSKNEETDKIKNKKGKRLNKSIVCLIKDVL